MCHVARPAAEPNGPVDLGARVATPSPRGFGDARSRASGLHRRHNLADVGSPALERKDTHMEYGIGGILILILVILAIVYFAKRV
jgi:hypothetical protein